MHNLYCKTKSLCLGTATFYTTPPPPKKKPPPYTRPKSRVRVASHVFTLLSKKRPLLQ